VVAKPDPKWGERPSMFVVAREGERPDAAELRTFLAERFPTWWLPDSFEFVEELPKTSVGKIDKKELRRRAASGATPSTSAATTD